jgi:hypothetical protein
VGFSRFNGWGIVMRMDLAEAPQGPRLVATFLCTGELKSLHRAGMGILQAAGPHLGLAQGETTERLRFHQSPDVLLSLICANWMVRQYSRHAQVSSEKHMTGAEAGAEKESCPMRDSGGHGGDGWLPNAD